MSQISNYQQARMLITIPTDLETFMMMTAEYKLNKNQRIGIAREGRAFGYLKSRFPKGSFEMSTPYNDGLGIDIVGCKHPEDQHGHDAGVTYQVGGPALIDAKLIKAMKYLQVTDKKVYLRNGKTLPLPLSEM